MTPTSHKKQSNSAWLEPKINPKLIPDNKNAIWRGMKPNTDDSELEFPQQPKKKSMSDFYPYEDLSPEKNSSPEENQSYPTNLINFADRIGGVSPDRTPSRQSNIASTQYFSANPLRSNSPPRSNQASPETDWWFNS